GLVVVRELDLLARGVEQRDVDEIRLERPPDLLADELEQVVELELGRQRVADLVDRRQLGEALAGLIDEADVLEGDTEARGKRPEQLDIAFRERVLAVDVLEGDDAASLVADEERDPHGRLRRLAAGVFDLLAEP